MNSAGADGLGVEVELWRFILEPSTRENRDLSNPDRLCVVEADTTRKMFIGVFQCFVERRCQRLVLVFSIVRASNQLEVTDNAQCLK